MYMSHVSGLIPSDLICLIRDDLYFLFFASIYFRIIIFYPRDFNPRVNKDIIIVIIIMKPNIFRIKYALPMIQTTTATNV